jgi:hypothetical protein
MHLRQHVATLLTIAGVLTAPVTFGACAGHGVRVYDPLYDRSYLWNRGEDRRYRRWEVETHARHVDFAQRPVEQQHAYFAWRHGR